MLAAPVAEGVLLGPSACLVDHGIGQPDGVEMVHDHGRMGKRCNKCAGVAAPRVQRHSAASWASRERGAAAPFRSRPVADSSGAPVLRDQGPIGRPGTARPDHGRKNHPTKASKDRRLHDCRRSCAADP
jgi:hypothetical protein